MWIYCGFSKRVLLSTSECTSVCLGPVTHISSLKGICTYSVRLKLFAFAKYVCACVECVRKYYNHSWLSSVVSVASFGSIFGLFEQSVFISTVNQTLKFQMHLICTRWWSSLSLSPPSDIWAVLWGVQTQRQHVGVLFHWCGWQWTHQTTADILQLDR